MRIWSKVAQGDYGKFERADCVIAVQKGQQKLTPEMVLERIVKETSLSEGDARNVIIMLRNLIVECARLGIGLDLGDIFSLRVYFPSKMVDNKKDVTAATLKTPKIIFTPKAKMRAAAKAADVVVDNPDNRKPKTPKPPKP